MKKLTQLIGVFLTGIIFTSNSSMANQTQPKNSLVWKIEGKNIPKPSYIVLTTPSLCEESPSIMAKMESIISGVKCYYTETDVNNPKESNNIIKELRNTNSDNSLMKILGNRNYLRVKAKVSKLNVSDDLLNGFKPVYANSLLSKSYNNQCDNPNYTEFLFRTYADRLSMPTKPLLSIEQAVSILDKYDADYWKHEILYLLDHESDVKQCLISKASFYKNEDFDGLKKLYQSNTFLNFKFQYPSVESMRKDMLVKRILEVISQNPSIITIDIGNVMNERTSVFAALQTLGYKVSPF